MIRVFWLTLLVMPLVVSHALAAEPPAPQDGAEDEAVVEERPMTQGELAIIIVRMLGLESEIDEAFGAQAGLALRPDSFVLVYTNFLASRGVMPLTGWEVDKEVDIRVLAVVVVQVTGLLGEVEFPDDPDSYVATLEARDIQLTSVRDVLSQVEKRNLVVQIVPGRLLGPYERNLSPTTGR